MIYEAIPLFGAPFEFVETYVYHDGPVTFSLRSLRIPDLYYFVNTVDVDVNSATALGVGVSKNTFHAVRSGLVPFRNVYLDQSENSLFEIVWNFSDGADLPLVSAIHPNDLTEDLLPVAGARLDLPTHTVEEFENDEILELSRAQNRTVFAVKVDIPGSNITEFPAKQSGEFQIAINGSLEALAKEIGGSESASIKEIRSNVIGLRAASFVVLMAIDNSRALFEPTEVTSRVFSSLNRIMEAVAIGDGQKFISELKTHNKNVRNKIKSLLIPLVSVGSGISITSAVAYSNQLRTIRAGSEDLAFALNSLVNVVPEISEIRIKRGILIGLNLRTKRFELVDSSSAKSYKGYMTLEASSEANGLIVGDSSFISAVIQAEKPFAQDEANNGDEVKYTLTSIYSFEDSSDS